MAVPYYKPIVNAIGLDRLIRPIDIPDMRLMVGSAECLEPLPLLIYQDVTTTQGNPLMKPYKDLTLEEAAEKIGESGLTVDDFPGNTLYLGDPTGAD